MLSSLLNAQKMSKVSVVIRVDCVCFYILEILLQEGLIRSYRKISVSSGLSYSGVEVFLKYSGVVGVIKELSRVSLCSKSVFCGSSVLWGVGEGLGFYIVRTSRGILTDREARMFGVGGELLVKVV
jgi:small subunit ribosomal protein S8